MTHNSAHEICGEQFVSTSKVKQVAWIENLIQNLFMKYRGLCLACGKKRVQQSWEERGARSWGGERWEELNCNAKEETSFACG